MEGVLFILFLIVVFVFVLPITAIVKSRRASEDARRLEHKFNDLAARFVQLEKELEKDGKQLVAPETEQDAPASAEDTEPELEPKPEPEPALPTGDETSVPPTVPRVEPKPALLAAKEAAAGKPAPALAKESPPLEPAHAVTTGIEGDSLPASEPGSFEMKLGTYWFVRIGVVLLLTGVGILAYYNREFFFNLSKEAKVAGFYLLSAVMGGVGFWLQRTKEKLRNYGQVLMAGGFAGVYFTTYAAHIFEPVRVIPNPSVALVLLFVCGGVLVWIADRLKSETLALFAVGASYYATYVPLIHTGTVSHWLILASNLVLATAAVAFMFRNRWLKMPVLSMAAAYLGFVIWRVRVLEEPPLFIVVAFAAGLWIVYTAAVFLARVETFGDARRGTFLTANNASAFGLLAWDVLLYHSDAFWILPSVFGAVLLGCAVVAALGRPELPLTRKCYLSQGLVLVTLGLVTSDLSDALKGPILAAESVVLLLMAVRREKVIFQVGAFIAAGIAAVYGFADIGGGSEGYLRASFATGGFLLFNGWACHRWLEAKEKHFLRGRVSYFTGLGMAVALIALMVHASSHDTLRDWRPAMLLGAAVAFTASVYLFRLREFVVAGAVPGVIGLIMAVHQISGVSEITLSLHMAFVAALALAHWWRWERNRFLTCCEKDEGFEAMPLLGEGGYSLGIVGMLLAWLHSGMELWTEWLWLGPLMALGLLAYGVVTRAPWIGGFGQVFLAIGCAVQANVCVSAAAAHGLVALLPIAGLVGVSLVLPFLIARLTEMPEEFRENLGKLHLPYRIGAAALGLLWIHRFVHDDYRVLVIAAVGAAFVILNDWRPSRVWNCLALAYAVVGGLYLTVELGGSTAIWPSLLAVVAMLGIQQLARRHPERFGFPDAFHRAIIVAGGVAIFFWASVRVSEWIVGGDGHGLRSITWGLLAVAYFGLGLGLKERTYRRMGLVTLGIALVSLAPIIWQMSTQLKIASFFVLGLVFVGLGFVYNHYKEQIRRLL